MSVSISRIIAPSNDIDGPVVSTHARKRAKGRSIPPMALELLQRFGSDFRAHGADVLIFDKKARARLSRAFGGPRGVKPIEKFLRTYAVISDDGVCVTVGHRISHLYR